MYFGSVKFFKHLIITTFIFLCIALLFMVIYFGGKGVKFITSIDDKHNKDNSITDKVDMQGKTDKDETKSMDIDEVIRSISVPEEYQKMFPDLYASFPKSFDEPSHTIYLSFDDGPSTVTEEILDILKKENIKATFFVTGTSDEYASKIFNRIVQEGHTIGIHTYSHIYKDIYKDVPSFLEDFNKMYQQIYDSTGVKAEIFRFAGGSINAYNIHNYKEIASEMLRRGFLYYDWNVSACDDSKKDTPPKTIVHNIIREIKNRDTAIVLMHDSVKKQSTVEALTEIIKQLKEKGYKFDKLNNHVKTVIFSYQIN